MPLPPRRPRRSDPQLDLGLTQGPSTLTPPAWSSLPTATQQTLTRLLAHSSDSSSACSAAASAARRAACDRVLLGNWTVPVFSATDGNFGIGNFATAPLPMPKGGGFVTIWPDGRIAGRGARRASLPATFSRTWSSESGFRVV